MKTKSQELATQEHAKRARVDEILKKQDATTEELNEADGLMAEIEGIVTERKAAERREQFAASNATALKDLKETPVNRPAFSGQPGQVALAGMAPAGETVLERGVDEKGRDYIQKVYEEGDLGIDEKTLGVISATSYKQAFRSYLRKGLSQMGNTELKTLQEGADSSGGFLVPEDVLGRIIEKKPTPTRVSGRVTRLQTSRDALTAMKVNYTADDIYTTGIRVTWTGEVPSSSTQHRVTDPVFGQIRIPIHTAMMSLPVTLDQIEDAAFPLVSWCSDKFNETIDLLYDDKIINGNGVGQPAGILMNPGGTDQPATVNTGDANLLTADGIINLGFALPEQYDMNSAFLFNKTSTGKAIAKLKDADNRYLWGAGLQDSGLVPSIRDRKLLGYDAMLSGLMPDVAANAYPIVFGDLTGYYHVQRVGFSIQVLRDRYAEENQVVLLGRVRFGGQVAEPFKLKVQKVAA